MPYVRRGIDAGTLRLFVVTLLQTLLRRLSRGPKVPSWPFTLEWIVGYLRRDWEETADWEPSVLRADLDARPYPQSHVRRVRTRDDTLGGVPARWFVPPGAPDKDVILFFHGGSYVYGSCRTTHADLIARIALATGRTVVGVDYRLAPEHPYPAQLEDALAAFDALVAGGRPPDRIVMTGDSAGGNLAIAAQIALRDRGAAQAAGLVLLSPWSDLEMPGASFTKNDPFDFGTRETLVRQARMFAGDVPLEDPRLSPVNARLDGLAPVLVVIGELEIPRDDIERLASALESAGVR